MSNEQNQVQPIKWKPIACVKSVDSLSEHRKRYKIVSKCPNCFVETEYLVLKGIVRHGNKVKCPNCECPYETV